MNPDRRREIVVDSDGGVDDAIALAWLLQRDDVEVVAVVAVWGNVAVTQAARNLSVVLEACGHGEVPVHVGRTRPYEPAPHIGVADFVHGTDGLADIGFPEPHRGPVADDGIEALVELATPDRTLLTLGPLTNIAAATSLDPSFASRWDDAVVMGGASADPGSALPGAVANVAHDPIAAHALVAGSWRRPPLLVEVAELPATVVTDPGPAWGTTVVDRRWLAWRQAADFHEQDAHDDLHPIRWVVRGERERFRHHVRSWWS